LRKIIFAIALVAPALLQASNIVLNPSFEDGHNFWTDSSFAFGGIGAHTGTGSAGTGCAGADCMTSWNGTTGSAFIYQDLPTDPGDMYDISFWFAAAGNPMELKVLFGSTTVFDLVDIGTTGYQL